jgi:hypothetical protein
MKEKYKDLNFKYVNNRLEEYNNLVQYYFILHTKQQMKASNVDFMSGGSWWKCNSRKKCIRI